MMKKTPRPFFYREKNREENPDEFDWPHRGETIAVEVLGDHGANREREHKNSTEKGEHSKIEIETQRDDRVGEL